VQPLAHSRPATPSIVRPSLSILAGSLGALLGSVVARVLMARALAPAELGVLVLAITVATALGGVASLGLGAAGARRVADLGADRRRTAPRAAARTAVAIGAAGGVLAGGALLLLAPRLAEAIADGREAAALAGALRAVGPIALALPVGLAAVGISRGFGRTAGRSLIRDGGGGAARAAAVAAAIGLGAGLLGIATAFALAVVAAEGLFLLWCARQGWLRPPAGEPPSGDAGPRWDARLVRGIGPFAHLEVLYQAYLWLDLLVLGLLAPAAAVGYFAIARSVARSLGILLRSPVHTYLPTAAAAARRGDAEAFTALYRHTRLVALAFLWVPLGVCLLVPEVPILLLVGPEYAPAAELLRLLGVAVLLEGLGAFMDQSLIARGAERAVARLQTAALALCLALLALLVPRLGAPGAALALVGTEAARLVALAALTAARGPLRRAADHLPPALSAALLLGLATALGLGAFPGGSELLRTAVTVAGAGAGSAVLLAAALRRV